MKSDQLTYLTAAELLTQLSNHEVSSLELVEQAIARIEALDKDINAVVVRDFVRAREAARAADAARQRGQHQPLLGLPITVKESFNVTGLTTSWAHPSFKEWMPKEDSLVISRLKNAGAIILGKTNVPTMLDDWQTYNNLYGTTNNPWNMNYTPGGSSGGSAAALAMGYVPLELGSDLAGSLRVPAHFCGVFAHKPSLDLLPLRGSGPPQSPVSTRKLDFVVAGPMARSAGDLDLMLDVLAGPDELSDGMGYKLMLSAAKQKSLRDFKVLLLDKHPLYPTDESILNVYDQLFHELQQAGVSISRTAGHLPEVGNISRLFGLLLGAWYSEVMTDDSYRASHTRAQKLLAEDKGLSAQFLRGLTINHRDWLLAARERDRLRIEWSRLYDQFDIILMPVTPTPAFLHDHSKNYDARTLTIGNVKMPYAHQYIWICIASMFGLPATTMPVGFTETGLPVGIQIMGNYLQDKTTLAFAQLLEKAGKGFVKPRIPL